VAAAGVLAVVLPVPLDVAAATALAAVDVALLLPWVNDAVRLVVCTALVLAVLTAV